VSVLITPTNPIPGEGVSVSDDEWTGIVVLATMYKMDIPEPTSHDPTTYSSDPLHAIAKRVEKVRDTPAWLRWLSNTLTKK